MTDTPDVTSYSDPEQIATAHESGMTFESAMEAVRNGYAVTREEWDGELLRIFQVFYRDQSFIVEASYNFRSGVFLQPHAPTRSDREAKDWKVVEHPVLWGKTSPRYRYIQP